MCLATNAHQKKQDFKKENSPGNSRACVNLVQGELTGFFPFLQNMIGLCEDRSAKPGRPKVFFWRGQVGNEKKNRSTRNTGGFFQVKRKRYVAFSFWHFGLLDRVFYFQKQRGASTAMDIDVNVLHGTKPEGE